jgi:soluble lytic murein transglycosylase-like protein
MQIKHATARGMGYDGPANGLLDAETNLKYAVKYLRGAWLVADGDEGRADRLYQRGYYYDAKRKGLLEATGLGRDRKRRRPLPLVQPVETPPAMTLPVALTDS